MKPHFKKSFLLTALIAANTSAIAPSFAEEEVLMLEEVIVTARRKAENLQEVPLSVNVMTAEQLRDLNFRQLEELQGLVAGLTIESDSIAPSSSLRGVRYDSFSGVTAAVAMYLNDAPVSQLQLTQAMFDVAQVEVLRGPQGTLQGISAPSGSISIRTQRPEFNEFGGFVDLTATDTDAYSARGAINIPLIDDMLAARVAASWEENELSQIKSISGDKSDYEHDGFRGSLRFEPTSELQIDLMYQELNLERHEWLQVESAFLSDPSLPENFPVIKDDDRKAVSDIAEDVDAEFETLVFEAGWNIGDNILKYIYMDQDMRTLRYQSNDVANAVSGQPWDGFPGMQNGAQGLDSHVWGESHEIRLSSTDRLFGIVDYSMGYFTIEQESDNRVNSQSYVVAFLPPGTVAPSAIPVAGLITEVPIVSSSADNEESWFVNLTLYYGDATELSLGVRDISYEESAQLSLFGNVINSSDQKDNETIYSASIKHNFHDDLMAYASYGESWRKGGTVVGNFSVFKSALQQDLENRNPETSESYEIGVKSEWLDNRLKVNVSAFHQKFDDYPYRPSEGTYFVNYAFAGFADTGAPIINPEVGNFTFVGSVPVEVSGIEVESHFQIDERWWINLLYSYAEGEIQNGNVPCNDYLPNDGVADAVGRVPTIFDIWAASGGPAGDGLTQCRVDFLSNSAPLWTTTLSSEYSFEIAGFESFVRGMWTFYDDSKNDPANQLDDVDAYNVLNLYAGVRDPGGKWQAQIYAKNLADTEEVIGRKQNPGSVGYTGINALTQQPDPALSGSIQSSYREIRMTPPREIGINVMFSF